LRMCILSWVAIKVALEDHIINNVELNLNFIYYA
jgi:hypothetical protein